MQPDYTKLAPELQEKIKGWQSNNPTNKQVQLLGDIADMLQELLSVSDENNKASESAVKALGAVLTDAREQLVKLNEKQAPEAPDMATPIVKALANLEKELKAAVKEQKAPVVNVPKADAPVVNVDAPQVTVDLSKIEKLIQTDLPKAFNDAIQSIVIPEVEIPEAPDRWDEVIEWLKSIDTASRLKPEPGTIKVTNPDGSAVGAASVESSVLAGEKTVALSGTPEALAASTACTYVLVQAKYGNTGSVFVGNASEQRVELVQGAAWSFAVNNLNKVYIRVATNGDGVNYTAGQA